MIKDLTPDIVKLMYDKGVTFLYAPGQFSEDDPMWVPMIVPLEEFYWVDVYGDSVLTITEALKLPFETFLNHKIIIPNNWDMH